MFKLHNSAVRWGDKLIHKDSPIKTQFDIYYLSLLVGVGLCRSNKFDSADVHDLTRPVTEPFVPYRHLLAGLLLVSELTNSRLPLTKPLVKSKVSVLLDSHSQTFLSDTAVELMNGYAFGGFEALREKMPVVSDVNEFLIWYYTIMIPECFEDEIWGEG